VNVTVPLVRPTADTRLLVGSAAATVRDLFRAGFNYAKAGVMLVDLQAAGGMQQGELDLFSRPVDAAQPASTAARPRASLMQALDELNRRFGRNSVRIGSATPSGGAADTPGWAVRRERRTPRYTTRWDEMPVVKT
jgi:DNA polymerase V